MANEQYMNYTDIANAILDAIESDSGALYLYSMEGVSHSNAKQKLDSNTVAYSYRDKVKVKELAEQYLAALDDPSPAATDFLKRVYFISDALEHTDHREFDTSKQNASTAQMFLKNIDRITEPAVRTRAARRMYKGWANVKDADIAKDALTMVLNSGNATIGDYTNMARNGWFRNYAELDSALAACDNLAEAALKSELSQEVPNPSRVSDITSAMGSLVSGISYNGTVLSRGATAQYDFSYANTLGKKYTESAILKSGAEYIPQYQAGLEKDLAASKTEIAALRKQLADLQATVENQSAQIKSQTDIIAKKNAELADMQNTQNQTKSKAEILRVTADKMRGGMGSSGVDNMKQKVAEFLSDLDKIY